EVTTPPTTEGQLTQPPFLISTCHVGLVSGFNQPRRATLIVMSDSISVRTTCHNPSGLLSSTATSLGRRRGLPSSSPRNVSTLITPSLPGSPNRVLASSGLAK